MIFWAYVLMSCLISLPPIILIWMIDQNKPKYYGHLLYGIMFIIYSILAFKGLTSVSVGIAEKFATYQSHPQNIINDFKDIKSNLDAWVYVIPAVIAAIGANLVTQFITAPKPQQS